MDKLFTKTVYNMPYIYIFGNGKKILGNVKKIITDNHSRYCRLLDYIFYRDSSLNQWVIVAECINHAQCRLLRLDLLKWSSGTCSAIIILCKEIANQYKHPNYWKALYECDNEWKQLLEMDI